MVVFLLRIFIYRDKSKAIVSFLYNVEKNFFKLFILALESTLLSFILEQYSSISTGLNAVISLSSPNHRKRSPIAFSDSATVPLFCDCK